MDINNINNSSHRISTAIVKCDPSASHNLHHDSEATHKSREQSVHVSNLNVRCTEKLQCGGEVMVCLPQSMR